MLVEHCEGCEQFHEHDDWYMCDLEDEPFEDIKECRKDRIDHMDDLYESRRDLIGLDFKSIAKVAYGVRR